MDRLEFLDLIESYQAEQATAERLFGAEGRGARQGTWSPSYLRALSEAATLVADVVAGRQPAYRLQEAMATSDFPYLFGDIIDRTLLGNYREYPSVWRTYCAQKTVNDFRTAKEFYVTGAEAVLAEVKPQSEYPGSSLADGVVSGAVKKYGRRLPFSWETIINDDLNALTDIPARFGRAARRSEDKFATQLHVGTTGPSASVYTVGNGNIITANPALSITGLQTAMTVLGAMVDADGEPIFIEAMVLEVPPALEVTGKNILNATQLWIDNNAAAGTQNQMLITENWMKSRVNLAVNPYIPIVASSSNGSTSWFLHAIVPERPAFRMAFLRGHTEPEIFIKEPNARRVSGGVDAMNGDFDTDSIEYKVRHVFGGWLVEPKHTVGSNGSGS